MNEPILYSRDEQGQYHPALYRVEDLDDMRYWPEGSHLVTVYPNGRSHRYAIRPDHAMVLSIVREFEEDLVEALVEAAAMRPSTQEVTPEQREAWNRMLEAFGEGVYGVHPSYRDVLDVFAERLTDKLEERAARQPHLRGAQKRYMTLLGMAEEQ